jgi:lysophospholipase L1-like esterase
MLLSKGQKLLFIGDSISDCGRARPAGEGRDDALGKGYVSMVDALLQSVYPELAIRVVNKGISGNTVRDLSARWAEDVLQAKPDWVAIMIGINDVWRQFDMPRIQERHVYKDEYETTLRRLVLETAPSVEGIVLMTPFYIEPNAADPMRAAMDQYGEVVRAIADEAGAVFVDTQAAFAPLLKEMYPAALAWDRVHPSPVGHMALARAFLNAIGFEWTRE